MSDDKAVVAVERIEKLIYLIRGQKVMLDSDLAEIYGFPRIVSTSRCAATSVGSLKTLHFSLRAKSLQT
jgi:hypothetical protein